jgi:hypothetical protein
MLQGKKQVCGFVGITSGAEDFVFVPTKGLK